MISNKLDDNISVLECPDCGTPIEVSKFIDGRCPSCHRMYKWTKYHKTLTESIDYVTFNFGRWKRDE